MKTYQDLRAVGENEQNRIGFIRSAINEHRTSAAYKAAADAEAYYNGLNPTINRYEKIIYDMQGRSHTDMWTANHKLASRFFGMAVDQEVSYLLGNGVTFAEESTKKKLCSDFDQEVMDAARAAKIAGVAFGFWDLSHLRVFSLLEFVPLYDEEDGALKAGVRFWQVAPDKPLRATLYEPDGFTEYFQPKNKDMGVLQEKRSYKLVERKADVGETEIFDGGNYPSFPIVPLKNNKYCLSEISGKRNTIDALDLASSNMVNNVDEGNLIYWVLSNCNGMDDLDDAKFVERLKTTHVAHANGDDGAKVESKTIEAPYEGTSSTIDMLKKKLYEDFQCFDSSAISAGNQTATAIKASYVPLDLKTDKFEAEVTRFIVEILRLAGIEDQPSYTRNQIINKSEETQNILLGAAYYDDEYITKKLLTINGDIDQYEDMMRRKAAEAINQSFDGPEEPVIDNGNA
nr:MAG TPA: PORTAL PROTEIN [Caudoviricetes sp.]